ncbi:lipopolysaccharide biosynthesis protein [Microvirga sp. 2TAF3]|uniref:lipopolysaccharide biosynthesis protein n=1 Tax=Microvirga sp. 2TAF3 TaxID=3233014 RepID=UPI003F947C97
MPPADTTAGPGGPDRPMYWDFRQIMAGRPVREAVRLALRLVGARGMSVVTLIVAAWLVDIQAFAEFGVYQTLASLAWLALFLRYDAAIVSSGTEEESGEALRLCLGVGLVLWLVFSGLAVAAGEWGWMHTPLALLLPFSILMRGMLRLTFARTTREGDFKALGRASMIQSVLQPIVLLVLILSPLEDALCFAVADVAGHASGVAYLLWRRRKYIPSLRHDWSVPVLLAAASRWKNLPLYNLPSSFLALAFVMSPLLIMPLTADEETAGHVALAYRIFDVPTQIVTAVSTPIFLHWLRPSMDRASAMFGRQIMLILFAFIGLGYAAIAGTLILADPLLAGSKLADLIDVVPVVAAFQLFVALAAPLSDSCALYPQQRRLVLIQVLALLGSVVAASFVLMGGPNGALLVLAVASALRTVALSELLRKLSVLTRQSFVPMTVNPAHPAP